MGVQTLIDRSYQDFPTPSSLPLPQTYVMSLTVFAGGAGVERSGVGGGVGHPIGLSDSDRADPKAVPNRRLLNRQDEDPADCRTGHLPG